MEELAPKKEENSNWLSRSLKVIAYPLSALMGGYYAHVSMRNQTYDRIKKYGGFEDILPDHRQNMQELLKPTGIARNVTEHFEPIHRKFTKKIDTRMEQLGFRNSFDYMKGLHHNEKLDTALMAFIAVGITLGVVLTIADSKSLRNLMGNEQDTPDRS